MLARIRPHMGSANVATLALLLAVICLGIGAGSASSSATKRVCNSQRIEQGGREYIFYKKNMSCERAKRYAHHVYDSNGNWEPRYFNCTSGDNFNTGAYCRKRRGQNEYFGWHPGD